MKRALAILLLVAPLIHAQELKPRPQPLPKLDRVLCWGVLGTRMEDAARTRYEVSTHTWQQWHEKELPQWMANSTPAMVGYGVAVSYAQYRASRFFVNHHMRWLATTTEVVNIGYDSVLANRNW